MTIAVSLLVAGPTGASAAVPDVLELSRGAVLSAPDRPPSTPGLLAPAAEHPLLVPDEELLAREKHRAARDQPIPPGSTGSPTVAELAPLAPLAPLASVFGGLNAGGLAAADRSPPDSTGAIGPSEYVQMVNSRIGVFDRTNLAPTSSADLDDFIGVSPVESLFDPQVQWDPQANRWFYVVIHDPDPENPGQNFLAFGWSRTASPMPLNSTSGWCTFFLDTGDQLEDYPKLGHNDNHIILGTNVFDDSGGLDQGEFLTARIWAISKPTNGDTGCTDPTASFSGTPELPLRTADGDDVFTPVPANTAESSANGFVVAADTAFDGPNRTQIMGWHVSGPKATPSLTADGNMTVAAFNVPADVPQPGTSNLLDSLDARLTQAVAVSDPAVGQQAVWTQHTIAGAGGRSVVRWYELLPGSRTVRQQGSVTDPSHFVFNGAVSPTSSGDRAAINYNLGSATAFAELRAQSRDGNSALGEMGLPLTLGTSPGADRGFTCGRDPVGVCRWGDYAGASPDPTDRTLVWGSNQLNGSQTSDPNWVTRNFALIADNTAPNLKLRGRRRQHNQRRVKVKVTSDEAVSVKVKGTIRVPKVRRARGGSSATAAKAKRFSLRSASTELRAGQTRVLKLKLRNNSRKRAGRALNRGKTSRATIKATATDAAGISAKAERKIRLKRKG